MELIRKNIHTIKKYLPVLFFVAVFITGLISFKDYGLGWDDEYLRRDSGYLNYNYIVKNDKYPLLNNNDKYHGPLVEIGLVVVEKTLRLTEMSDIYKIRRLLLFTIFFVSLIAFYFISLKITNNYLALVSCLFLFLTPRIFAESFYNSKDIAFLSLIIISFFTFLEFIKKKTLLWALIHALTTSFTIDVRILGIMIPLLTTFYYLVTVFKERKFRSVRLLAAYLFLSTFFVILFWPVLWEGPIFHFVNAFHEMKNFPWPFESLYNGKYIESKSMPWHYLPVWILITTPILYSILFIYGSGLYVKDFLSNPIKLFFDSHLLNSALLLLSVPILSVILFRSVVYDGWRHVYFVYPFFILFAVYGLNSIYFRLQSIRIYKNIFQITIFFNSAFLIYWMIKSHPFQNVYFNTISRRLVENIPANFELDYWGLSYKQGLEYILANDQSDEPIKIAMSNRPGDVNLKALPTIDQSRFILSNWKDTTCKYYLTNYRFSPTLDNLQLRHQLMVDDIPILGIYDRAD
jgi:hypothetical protein